jgi:hypothetical protein
MLLLLFGMASGKVDKGGAALGTCRELWARKEGTYQSVREQLRHDWQAELSRPPPKYAELTRFDPFETSWSCESTERVGGPIGSLRRYVGTGDGPKYMCGLDVLQALGPSCLVYNIGSNNEIGFEYAMANLTRCEVHTFDPTMTKPYIGNEYSHFHKLGLRGGELHSASRGTQASAGQPGRLAARLRSMKQLVSLLGHRRRRIDVLKVDCEGCEWEALMPIFSAMAIRQVSIGQLLVEVHLTDVHIQPGGRGRSRPSRRDLISWFIAAERAGLRIFHKVCACATII